jgi:hypothetical protein
LDYIYHLRSRARLSHPWIVQDMGWTMTNILDLRHDWFRGKTLDAIALTSNFRKQGCSDPRDKIYGLLGLMGKKPCRADYSRSCFELYIDVIIWAYRQQILLPCPLGTRRPLFSNQRPLSGLTASATILNLGTTLGLTATDLREAHIRFSRELGDDWPLQQLQPW